MPCLAADCVGVGQEDGGGAWGAWGPVESKGDRPAGEQKLTPKHTARTHARAQESAPQVMLRHAFQTGPVRRGLSFPRREPCTWGDFAFKSPAFHSMMQSIKCIMSKVRFTHGVRPCRHSPLLFWSTINLQRENYDLENQNKPT